MYDTCTCHPAKRQPWGGGHTDINNINTKSRYVLVYYKFSKGGVPSFRKLIICIMHEGPPMRKNNVSLGGPHILSLYRCNYPSAVAPVAACEAALVRLC